ncbi:MAG: DUF4129 domain-containing protein [Akkermansiaceae bacterium]|nr:DUF4129 domain-containing protein [Akkermansiaceae bacterium]
MRLEDVTAEIRPRSDWEAVDLGMALVRRDFWRCLVVWWLALTPVLIAGWWLRDHPILWLMLFWWFRPVGSRMVLFELSRRLFGEKPSWRAMWREIPRAWSRRFFYRFLWARLSPWIALTLPVGELEGLRGKPYRTRCNQIVRRGESSVMWIYFIAELAAGWFGIAILLLVAMLLPEGQDGGWQQWADSWNPDTPGDIPVEIVRAVCICYAAAMGLADVFLTGSGFGVYLNNRTWIEGWDVELAFKRLAARLGKSAVALVFGALCFLSGALRAEADPAQTIREIKADPAFEVHTVTEKVADSKGSSNWNLHAPPWLGDVFLISVIGLILGLLGWLIWKYRFALTRSGGGESTGEPKVARVVMGLDVSPETLPEDVPGTAWKWWREGRHHDALGLLYRGTIASVIRKAGVEIQEADTEGDCQRRVDAAGEPAHPHYFRALTAAWMVIAYAGRIPADSEVESLCKSWPFVERRAA